MRPLHTASASSSAVALAATGTDVEALRWGEGETLLYLHGEDGLVLCGPFLEALGAHFTVLAPTHPGWAPLEGPSGLATVRDVADLYVELVEQLAAADGRRIPVVGSSIGAWMAAEMVATRHPAVGQVVLIAPIGVKFGGRTERDFVDLYALHPVEQQAALRSGGISRLTSLDDDALLRLTQAQEATARLCWEPYFHDPGLPRRLGRVRSAVTILQPSDEGFVLRDRYYERYASLFGGSADLVTVPGSGHRVEEDAPAEAAAAVVAALAAGASGTGGG